MSAPGFNGTRQIIDIPGDGSAFQAILATGPVRYIKVVESLLTAEGVANTLQGFNYEIPNDNTTPGFSQVLNIPPSVVLELGDPMSLHGIHGALLGNGPNVVVGIIGGTPATTLFTARSQTATATSIEVTQYY